MEKITISTGRPDAGRIYAEAYDAALYREAALREELERTKKAYEAYGIDFDRSEEKAESLQQRLTVAEQRAEKLTGILRDVSEYVRHPDYDWYPCDREAVSDALNPAAEACGIKPAMTMAEVFAFNDDHDSRPERED